MKKVFLSVSTLATVTVLLFLLAESRSLRGYGTTRFVVNNAGGYGSDSHAGAVIAAPAVDTGFDAVDPGLRSAIGAAVDSTLGGSVIETPDTSVRFAQPLPDPGTSLGSLPADYGGSPAANVIANGIRMTSPINVVPTSVPADMPSAVDLNGIRTALPADLGLGGMPQDYGTGDIINNGVRAQLPTNFIQTVPTTYDTNVVRTQLPIGYGAASSVRTQVPGGYGTNQIRAQLPAGYGANQIRTQVPSSLGLNQVRTQLPAGYGTNGLRSQLPAVYRSQVPSSFSTTMYQTEIPGSYETTVRTGISPGYGGSGTRSVNPVLNPQVPGVRSNSLHSLSTRNVARSGAVSYGGVIQ